MRPEDLQVVKLDNPAVIQDAATFFHNKWGVETQAYVTSMQDSLKSQTGVPAWFYVKVQDEIVAGLGIIENDFHKRKDLRPNICAVYVREDFQGHGIAKEMLSIACEHLATHNINDVYLITTHTQFYEHCGFDFFDMIEEDDGELIRCYHKKIVV